jgi:hypothetical protein
VRQDGAGDLLVVVADRRLRVRQGALDTAQHHVGAVRDRRPGGLTRPPRLRHVQPGRQVEFTLGGLVQGHTHAVAFDRLRVDPQQPVLDQPMFVGGAQQRETEPVAALTVVHVRDEPVDGDRLGLLLHAGGRPLPDRDQTAVLVDVDLLDGAGHPRRQFPQVRPVTSRVDPVHLLEEHVPERQHQQGLLQVLRPREPVPGPRCRFGLLPDHRQAQLVGDELRHPGFRAGRLHPPRGAPHRQRHRAQHRRHLGVGPSHGVVHRHRLRPLQLRGCLQLIERPPAGRDVRVADLIDRGCDHESPSRSCGMRPP